MEIETTWGTIAVELLEGKVGGCTLPFLPAQPDHPFSIAKKGDVPISAFIASVFQGLETQVPPLEKPVGTDFQQQVWRAIAAIPSGQTRTYGELAEAIGRPRAVRAVGTACGRNPLPLFIPCHRVVAASGGLGGFSAGLAWKLLLLRAERSLSTKPASNGHLYP
jgi:O-6-methylguanine DNA methyltransferase